MRSGGEASRQVNPKAIDFISAVSTLHGHNCHDLGKLLKESNNNTLKLNTEYGSSIQIDIEELAKLPIHLMAKLVQSELDEEILRYALFGIRLIRNLYDATPRHIKLEQIMLDDIPLLKQLVQLIFYVLISLNGYLKANQPSTPVMLLHSTIVGSSLLLFDKFVSRQQSEVANIIVGHPKVDVFMDAAFSAVRAYVEALHIKISGESNNYSDSISEESIKHLCVQCEVSLTFLHSLCQQKNFRDRLVQHKVLCGQAGILLLVQAVLNLDISPFPDAHFVGGALSRMKSRVLSIMLHLCEAESISYLDEVASTSESLTLAKSVAFKVLELLKTLFSKTQNEPSTCSDKDIPKGHLQLYAMRLADVFSDDSNFRSYVTLHITEVLTTLFSHPNGEFLSSWCSSDLAYEEDATLEADPFLAAESVFNFLSSKPTPVTCSQYAFIPCNMPRASYAHQRTSLLVKVIANLHCFVPDICKEEKDLFLSKFYQCLLTRLSKTSDELFCNSVAEKVACISKNFHSLLSHAESLIPSYLNEEDVELLRTFINQLEPLLRTLDEKVAQSTGGCSSVLSVKASPAPDHNNGISDLKEGVCKDSALQEVDQSYVGKGSDQADDESREYRSRDKDKPGRIAACGLREKIAQNVETSGSDSSDTRGKNFIDQIDDVQDDEKAGNIKFAEQQRRKRKRTIMNDRQTGMMEEVLKDKPDMQRHRDELQLWADRLSEHGSEVTASQLKNWLNNRRAKLARVAKDVRGLPEGDNSHNDKQGGSGVTVLNGSSETPVEDPCLPWAQKAGIRTETGGIIPRTNCNKNPKNVVAELVDIAPVEGQYVMVVDGQGTEVGKAKVFQVNGIWLGKNLEELGTCVVDIIELKGERLTRLPHPYEDTGTSFYNAEKQHGVMRVLWDTKKLFVLQWR
ncbi:nodulin homeobox [Daucus carota subsp. sativus]|uniref:nodulin homeobox n=1 Tax=Daucus carota subsp. sativus TaxID=79200 RepID=UPI0007EF095D|nr:PREDICTED: nodulin homeobox-like [Daucus carota subsp. sativus]XP_017236272.1 PREDICTED: nodulin homeobox-like [Daucus carota subsp. sativus]XP_017236273.1 PREDICTED: nodulin homeobox-like [Daucus carota subsp. sativus]